MSIYVREKDTHSNNAVAQNVEEADFVNDVSEEEQRWGSKLINKETMGDDVVEEASLEEIRQRALNQDKEVQKEGNEFSRGYGGKFGVEDNQEQSRG